jgi:uncharacterized membrane protein
MNAPGRKDAERAGVAGIAILLGAALALRLWHLGARSLWTDEASTWTATRGTLAELLRFCLHEDASPPLYYMLTSVALWFGDGETQLRMVSVMASVALVWLTYRFARLYAPRAESQLAAGLVAVSGYQVMYAQEARTYMLVAAWMTLATYLFVRAVWHGRARLWPFYALALAAAFYTQTIGLLAVGAHGALVLLIPAGRRQWRGFALALLGATALYAPWMIASMQHADHLPQSHWYIPWPDARGTFLVLRTILISPISLVSAARDGTPGLGAWMPALLAQALVLLAPLVPPALALPALLKSDSRGAALRVAAAAVLLPLAAVFIVSLRSSLWLPRYFVFTTPFIALLVAHGVMHMRPAALRTGWIALMFAISAFALWRYDVSWTKEPWRDAAGYMLEHDSIANAGSESRAAALVTFDDDALRYYLRRAGNAPHVFEVSHPDDPFASAFTLAQLEEVEAAARARTAAFDGVWVVVRSPNSDVRREVARRTEAVAAEGRFRESRTTFMSDLGPVRVTRFTRPVAAAADSAR